MFESCICKWPAVWPWTKKDVSSLTSLTPCTKGYKCNFPTQLHHRALSDQAKSMRVLQNDTKQMKEITHQKNLLAFYKFLPFKESAHPLVLFFKKHTRKLPSGLHFLLSLPFPSSTNQRTCRWLGTWRLSRRGWAGAHGTQRCPSALLGGVLRV